MTTNLVQKFLDMQKVFLVHNQIYGLATFTYTDTNFRFSKLRCFYIISLLTVFCLLMACFLAMALTVTSEDSIYKGTTVITVVSSTIYVATTWIFCLVKCHEHMELLSMIIDFDVKLQTSCVIINHQKSKKRTVIKLAGRYIYLALLVVYYIKFSSVSMEISDKSMVLPLIFMAFFNSAVCYQTIELVSLLRSRFKILNKQISILVKQFATSDSVKFVSVDNRKKFFTLSKICALHHHLTKSVKLFNAIFGVTLLFMFGVSFIVIVLSLFYTSAELQSNEIAWNSILTMIAPSISFFIDLIWVCDVCYSTIEEVRSFYIISIRCDICIFRPNGRESLYTRSILTTTTLSTKLRCFLCKLPTKRLSSTLRDFFL
jgi:hypothetical protein